MISNLIKLELSRTHLAIILVAICVISPYALSQTGSSVSNQVYSAFAGSNSVLSIQLTGTANWYAGSLEDSGNVTLTANSAGVASMQISLAQEGSRVESQSAIGGGMTCQWAGNDGVSHPGDSMNCLKPLVWFLPAITLQQASLPSGLSLTSLGTVAVDSGTSTQIQAYLTPATPTSNAFVSPQQASATNLAVDPTTFLPQTLSYQICPDNGALVSVQIQIQYSNYQNVNGVEIPFLIQRYLNGSLQLEIQLSASQLVLRGERTRPP